MQRSIFSSITTLGAIGFVLLAVFLPALTVPCALISTTLFAFVTALSHPKVTRITSQSIIAVFYIITLIVTKDPIPGLMILLLFYPAGLAAGYCCMMKKRVNSIGAHALLYGSVFFLLVFIVYAIFSTYPDISFTTASENIKNMFIPEIEKAISAIFGGGQDTASEYDYIYSYEYLATLVYSYIPTVVGLWLLVSSYIASRGLKLIYKYFDQDASFMGGFSDFRVSRTGAYVYFLATIVSLFAMGSALSVTALNFSGVMSVVLSFAGISLISFLLELKNVSDPIRYIIIAVLLFVGLMPFGLSYLLSLVGLLDSYLDIRERLKNSGI